MQKYYYYFTNGSTLNLIEAKNDLHAVAIATKACIDSRVELSKIYARHECIGNNLSLQIIYNSDDYDDKI